MKRGDFYWALKAVLAHVGSAVTELDRVGFEFRDGQLWVYATDRYTIGIARVNDGPNLNCALSKAEATELMRYVRPKLVADNDHDIVYARRLHELHIGYAEPEEGETLDARVFETCDFKISLDYLLDYIKDVDQADVEWDEQIYLTRIIDRFSEARRKEADRLRIMPHRGDERRGVAVVTVGHDFIGAISGLMYDQEGPLTVAEFLQPEEGREAA